VPQEATAGDDEDAAGRPVLANLELSIEREAAAARLRGEGPQGHGVHDEGPQQRGRPRAAAS